LAGQRGTIGKVGQYSLLVETDRGDERERDAADNQRDQKLNERDAAPDQHGSLVRSTTVFTAAPTENVTLSRSSRTPLGCSATDHDS